MKLRTTLLTLALTTLAAMSLSAQDSSVAEQVRYEGH
jgi:hypothetical protein